MKGDFYQKFDTEAKMIQEKLMARDELKWIMPYCGDANNNEPGSFIAHLYQFIEGKLVLAVSSAIRDEFNAKIAAIIFDGFNIADKSLHGH